MAITYYSPSDIVLPETFGALGDGTTDDTTSLQHAINTGKIVVGKRGSTYTVSSLIVSTPYQTIDLTGATLKRKNTTTGSLLRLTGNFTKVLGGNFDGNTSNQGSPSLGDRYGYVCISVEGDNCEVAHCTISDEAGIGVKGYTCEYANIHDNAIIDCELYGVYIAHTTADAYGNRIISNYINTANTNTALGIYLTGSNDLVYKQRRWEVANNVVEGDSASASSEAVGITTRGSDGIVANNHVNGYCLGISCDSTDRTTINGNRVENVNSETKYCYELNGSYNTFTGNYGKPLSDGYGLFMSNPSGYQINYNSINGNTFEHGSGNFNAITIQPAVGEIANYNVIAGNSIKTNYRAITAVRNTDGLTITGNTINGPGSGTSQSRSLYLNENPGRVTLVGNIIHGFERIVGCYSAVSVTFIADSGTDIITASGHGLLDNDPIMVSTTTTLPGGLSSTVTYFARDITTDTLKVSATRGGTAINITSAGSGTHTIKRAYSGLNVTSNDFSQNNPAAGNWVVTEGSAVFGHRVQILWNIPSSYNQLHYLDRGFNVQIQYSDVYSTPESGVTAGVGSLFLSSIGGVGTTLFVKQAGTGNTGWAGK